MNDPFENVPLNIKKVFVMGKTWSGCKVYLPVDSHSHAVQIEKRDELHAYLASQPKPPPVPILPKTA